MLNSFGDLTQFHSVACREYTLPREDEAPQPKELIQGNTKIGPGLWAETIVTPGLEFLMDQIILWSIQTTTTEIPEDLPEEQALQLKVEDFACRSKAKAKPQRRESTSSSTRTILTGERTWTDIEPQECSLSDYSVSNNWFIFFVMVEYLEKMMERLNSGEFKIIFRIILCSQHWSDEKWKSSMARGGGNKKRYQYCTDASGEILYLRALRADSGRSLIDPTLQDNVILLDGFFQYIYHVGCAINFRSIINSGLILGGHNLSNRQTVFFHVCGSHGQKSQGSWCDRLECTTSCTVLAQRMEET